MPRYIYTYPTLVRYSCHEVYFGLRRRGGSYFDHMRYRKVLKEDELCPFCEERVEEEMCRTLRWLQPRRDFRVEVVSVTRNGEEPWSDGESEDGGDAAGGVAAGAGGGEGGDGDGRSSQREEQGEDAAGSGSSLSAAQADETPGDNGGGREDANGEMEQRSSDESDTGDEEGTEKAKGKGKQRENECLMM